MAGPMADATMYVYLTSEDGEDSPFRNSLKYVPVYESFPSHPNNPEHATFLAEKKRKRNGTTRAPVEPKRARDDRAAARGTAKMETFIRPKSNK